jgi:hypothetical protein
MLPKAGHAGDWAGTMTRLLEGMTGMSEPTAVRAGS